MKMTMKLQIGFHSHLSFYFVFILLLINLSSAWSQKAKVVDTRAVDNNVVKGNTDTKVVSKGTPAPAVPADPIKNQNVLDNKEKVTMPTVTKGTGHINCSLPEYVNTSICKENDDGMVSYFLKKMSSNSGMLFRTMYVLLAVTGVVIVYFVIKAIRLRRRRSKSRKYGIITKQGDHGDMEMEPLGDGMDEDDDYTVFEMGRRK